MAELFEAIASPWNLLGVLLVFGFAPGVVLRVLVLLYSKADPRRGELVAELYTVPRAQRPLWVAEQIETALFEGLGLRWAARSRGRRHAIYRIAIGASGTAGLGAAVLGFLLPQRQTLQMTAGTLIRIANAGDGKYVPDPRDSISIVSEFTTGAYFSWAASAVAMVAAVVLVCLRRRGDRRRGHVAK